MSFPRYPAYKPSSVEWLGEVPEHWEALRLRFVAQLNPSKQEVKEVGDQEMVSFLPMEAIGEDGSIRLEHEKEVGECLSGYTYFRDGDVCVTKITPCFENGKGAILRELKGGIGFGTTELIVARPDKEKITSKFLDYLFRSSIFRRLGESEMYGAGGQKRVPDSFVRDFTSALPSIEEQRQLTRFLDRETAKIDALIAEQQCLIELLQEKRQAVISHAVTKGLNPNAPMKDSGVEWLGEVPEHWEVTRFKRFCVLQRGHDLTNDEREEGPYPVVTSAGINGFHSKFIASPPGVITGRYGSTGTVFYVEEEYWPHNTSLYIKDFHGNSPRFSWYLLQAIDLKSLSAKSAVPGIDRNDVHELFVSFPCLQEQLEISIYLDDFCHKQAVLTDEVISSVRLLQERRSALISAAVTGQIDVRGLVEAEGSEL